MSRFGDLISGKPAAPADAPKPAPAPRVVAAPAPKPPVVKVEEKKEGKGWRPIYKPSTGGPKDPFFLI